MRGIEDFSPDRRVRAMLRGETARWVPAGLTTSSRATGGAAAKVRLPGWVAVRVVVPGPTKVRMFPLIVATAGSELPKVTGRPELAVAVRASGRLPKV